MNARRSIVLVSCLPAVAALSWLARPTAASSAEEPSGATCTADGTALQITAYDNKFDKDCLAVPADQAFTIEFKNEDRGIPHNVSIYDTSQGSEKALYKGELTDGGTVTYNVPAQPAGKYLFRCDPHPEFMKGAFLVG